MNGPYKGALGLHGSLFGSVTGTTTSSVSMVGVRYFVSDAVPEADTFALATVRPGLGVTLYTP
ncbi:hypothetical protein [Cystobacter fuscus]|uniref:hypothetical protein n=1 Tax=Cystobacter fuscus TaxID=43 RepID=UPI0012FD0D1B|nr:hypothetical protein [Cystobacter fuscus]